MSALDDPKVLGSTRLGFAEERDVDLFVDTLARFERGEIDSDAWRAFRLVHGVYGQRQDGESMVRVKIPQGILTAAQLRVLAGAAERWSNGKGHITTRQNIQFHFVRLDTAGDMLRQLAEAGLTTREACGNSVRNVTTCPHAGTSAVEPFDPTPYAEALTRHLLRGPWSSTLPRKFKIAFGGCCAGDCVKAGINDLGFLARREGDRPGFRLTIGGGTAALTRSGFLAHDFLPAGEILEAAEAVVRVFHRIGDRNNKHKARLKYVVERLGVDGFLVEYRGEREKIRTEGGRPLALPPAPPTPDAPPPPRIRFDAPPGFAGFSRDNIRPQKQPGFVSVSVRVPLGDLTAAQFLALADLTETYSEGGLRLTHDQNLVLRFVPESRAPELFLALARIDLARAGVGTILDVTSCPGSMSCKLAVTASRGVAGAVTELLERNPATAEQARGLTIKASGCPNGCGQHHIAGLGFQGGVRKVAGRAVPQYHLFLGGGVRADGATFGRLAAKIPARRATAAVERLIRLYASDHLPGEAPDAYFARVSIESVQRALADLAELSEAQLRPEDLVDLGEELSFVLTSGKGECAT